MPRTLLAGLILLAAAAAAASSWQAQGKRWWSHVRFLADDRLEGRNTGSEGHHKAALYVAGEFERAGLKPAGGAGYLQPVPFHVFRIVEERSSLELVRDGAAEPVKIPEEARFSVRSGLAESIEAPAVFVGYGLTVPELGYDDLAGLDLHGKIAVYLSGGPADMPGPLKAHYSSAVERWNAMRLAGVVGTAALQNPKSMDLPWERASAARLMPAMSTADPALAEATGMRFSIAMNADRAERFFAKSGHTFAEILADADANRPVPRFPLGAGFRAKVAIVRSEVESQNVVGLFPGSELPREDVVLSAHLDHLGVGPPVNGDRVFNGAMDDASGVASLIEIAKALKSSKAVLKRSVLFLAVTGEEKGLEGSKYFAAHPTVDGTGIVADINMDMFLPLYPLRSLEVQGLDESTLGDDIRAVAARAGVTVQADKMPDRNRFIRSDQYSFIRKGIPALAFKFGYEAGSREETLQKEWLKNRYHGLSDDADQPVDLAAAAQFNHIILELAERLANAAERPHWKPESFFRRFAK